METNIIYNEDCITGMQRIPDSSIDLILTDPPYNIGKDARWDRIPNYTEWTMLWIIEAQRVLKPTGVMYFWHNDIGQVADILVRIKENTDFVFRGMLVWDKGKSFHYNSWGTQNNTLRSWFNVSEYCFHFFKTDKSNGKMRDKTGLEMIYSNPACFRTLKEWYHSELKRLFITEEDIARKYEEETGRKPHMLKHYFKDTQFEIPTEKVWDAVYRPLGFKKEYEDLKKEYEDLRPCHNSDAEHCNIWRLKTLSGNRKIHPCQKPVAFLERMIKVSTRGYGCTVLDPFSGSGSTAIACLNTGRQYIGFEIDPEYYADSMKRIADYK